MDPEEGSLVQGKDLGAVRRRDMLVLLAEALGVAALVLAVYFLVPTPDTNHTFAGIRLAVGLVIFVAVLVQQVGAILRSHRPIRRGVVALAIILPLFIVIFASTYLTMSAVDPNAFSEQLTKVNGLYFTITVLSTVGFGDITPVGDAARMVVSFQMILDLVLIAMGARLLVGAAQSRFRAESGGGQG